MDHDWQRLIGLSVSWFSELIKFLETFQTNRCEPGEFHYWNVLLLTRPKYQINWTFFIFIFLVCSSLLKQKWWNCPDSKSSSSSSFEGHPLQARHKQNWGRGFILLLPQTAALPGSDAGSDVIKPASSFVIQNRQTACSMWCPMYGAHC